MPEHPGVEGAAPPAPEGVDPKRARLQALAGPIRTFDFAPFYDQQLNVDRLKRRREKMAKEKMYDDCKK